MEADTGTAGKVVIVTGASSGIGRAVAGLAARRDYRVVLSARREDRLQALARQITEHGGTALVVAGDIADPVTQQRLVDVTLATYGRLDVLVNNAGLPLPASFRESPVEELRRQWEVNVVTLATLTRRALPALEATGGTVINVGSAISRFPVPGMGNYAPTKIAVAGLSTALRRELAPRGVAVCLVEPGPVATEFTARAGGWTMRGGRRPAGLSISAAAAAGPIVRLFTRPVPRVVVPGWMAPLLAVAGALMQVAGPVVDAVYRRRRG